jgi:hypothetical protein
MYLTALVLESKSFAAAFQNAITGQAVIIGLLGVVIGLMGQIVMISRANLICVLAYAIVGQLRSIPLLTVSHYWHDKPRWTTRQMVTFMFVSGAAFLFSCSPGRGAEWRRMAHSCTRRNPNRNLQSRMLGLRRHRGSSRPNSKPKVSDRILHPFPCPKLSNQQAGDILTLGWKEPLRECGRVEDELVHKVRKPWLRVSSPLFTLRFRVADGKDLEGTYCIHPQLFRLFPSAFKRMMIASPPRRIHVRLRSMQICLVTLVASLWIGGGDARSK